MALPIWTFAMMGYTVGWRDDGETYQVLMNGSVKLARKDESDGVAEWIFQRVTTVVVKMRKGIEVVQLDPPPEKTKQLKI